MNEEGKIYYYIFFILKLDAERKMCYYIIKEKEEFKLDYKTFLQELEEMDNNEEESITIETNIDSYTIGKASNYLCGGDEGVISEVLGNTLFDSYYGAGVATHRYLTEELQEEVVDVMPF